MAETSIRRAVPSDLPYLYDICLKTGDSGNDATPLYTDPCLLGQYYVAPYVIFPGGLSWIVEHEFRPQGFIVAAPDSRAYRQWMEDEWLRNLRLQFPLPAAFEKLPTEKDRHILEMIHRTHMPIDDNALSFLDEYPAHLHINLLPCLQRQGYGQKLMNNLFAELSRQGVPGLQLGVGKKRLGANAFYRKVGFSVLKESENGYTLGIKISRQG